MSWFSWYPGSQLKAINAKLGEIVTAQDDINAAVQAIQSVTADLVTAVANIQAELAALPAPVDTSALNAAIAPLQAVQAQVDALESPAPPSSGG